MSQKQRYQLGGLGIVLVGMLLLVGVHFVWQEPARVRAQSNDEEPNSMIQTYADTLGVSYEEAKRRLELQAEMSQLERKVIDGEPTYAGSWTQHEPDFRLIVTFTAPNGEEIIQKYLKDIAWADLVEVRQAKYTVAELTTILEQVNQAALATGVPFESGANIPGGTIRLYTPQPDELRRQLETQDAMKAYLGEIEFIYQAALSVPAVKDEPDPGIESYAKLIGISLEEAERRLKLQTEMNGLERKVIEGEPTYAGSWTVHEPEFGLMIAFAAADGEEKIRNYLDGIEWADLVKVQQSPYSYAELLKIFDLVTSAANETGVPFESGADPRTAKVNLYTPEPDKLRSELEAQGKIPDHMADITFIFQESLKVPVELKYPYLPGGIPISACTAGFAVKRNSDNLRFMMTAGHCGNVEHIIYNGAANVYLGPIVYEVYNGTADMQMHDVGVRSLDLTNGIFTSPATTVKVTATETKATTLGDYVCKYGRTTAYTCGYVTNIASSFVRVDRPFGVTAPIACAGDSGAPVFIPAANSVTAVGMLVTAIGGSCNHLNNVFDYVPVDTVNSAGFSILTSHYQQRYHQKVFAGAGLCLEYVTPYDDNGYPTAPYTNSACPATTEPGSGTLETYTAWVVGGYWREGMWRGGFGYTRNVPLNSNGTINWPAAPTNWTQCCGPATAPRSQDAYIVGNYYYQNVYWAENDCKEYIRLLDNNGNPTGGQTVQDCRTTLPPASSGTITSYTAYVVGGRLREGIWRGGLGYVRDVPLNASNTDINWASNPAWVQCCSGISTTAQGGDVLSYP